MSAEDNGKYRPEGIKGKSVQGQKQIGAGSARCAGIDDGGGQCQSQRGFLSACVAPLKFGGDIRQGARRKAGRASESRAPQRSNTPKRICRRHTIPGLLVRVSQPSCPTPRDAALEPKPVVDEHVIPLSWITLQSSCLHPEPNATRVNSTMLMRVIGHPPARLANRVTRIRQRPFRQSRVAGGRPWPWDAAFKRGIHVPAAVAPPLILTGLFVALWTWKCTMLVLFQNTIIYNPFMPPNARSLRIAEFARQCRGIQWREERIRSLDGTEIALCVSDEGPGVANHGGSSSKTPVYILYFQGKRALFPSNSAATAADLGRQCLLASASTPRPLVGASPITRTR